MLKRFFHVYNLYNAISNARTCMYSSFSFSMEKEMFRLVVLPCFDLCRSNSFHVNTQLGVGRHWWFNYPGPLLDAKLEFACLSG